jgi:hypothetical protein
MATRRKARATNAPFQFDPNSLNATLATIIANQKAHGEEMRTCFGETREELLLIKAQAIKTNGRVNMLELWRATSRAKLAGIAAAFGFVGSGVAWAVSLLGDGK